MADALIGPAFAIPRTTGISPSFFDVGGAEKTGFGQFVVDSSFAADEELELWFPIPGTSLPSGTPKLHLWFCTTDTTGKLTCKVDWEDFADDASIDNPTLNSEAAADMDFSGKTSKDIYELKIPLDAVAISAAGNRLLVKLKFTTASTSAVPVGFTAELIWE